MEKRIIEVNGVKMELDLRHAKVVDNFRVGDNVKVLVKHSYESKYESKAGVIIGFDNFQKLPTIVIAYLDMNYSEAAIKYVYLNENTKDVEVCPANEGDIPFEKERVIELLERDILKKEEELRASRTKKEHFHKMFGAYFEKAGAA